MDLAPRKIDKYIVKKFLSTFFLALLFIIVVVIIFDVSEKIDKFVANQPTLNEILFDYYLNFVPYFINMFSPLFIFITVIFFTSKMAQNSEIIAILSGGVSYQRMMMPFMFCAALISAMSLVLGLWIIPNANKTRVKFENTYVKDESELVRDVHFQIAPNEFVYVESFSSWNSTAYNFTLEKLDNNKIISKLSAESAVWDTSFSGWRLRNYFIRDFSEDLNDKITTGAQIDTVINLVLTDMYRNKSTVEALPLGELNDMIETQKMRGDANVMYAQIEKNTRYAMPFSAFVLTIMGVCLSSRRKRGGLGWNLVIGIALSFSYILFMKFSQMFVYTGTMSAGLALWLPNMIYTAIAGYLYYRAPK